MPAADPNAAPHCPACRYNLHGLQHLRCPECGFLIDSPDDHERARWLAARNAPDRCAELQRRLAVRIGGALFVLGFALCVWSALRNQYIAGFYFCGGLGGALILAVVYLYLRN